jgi:antitoxin (DNA-binding transcriptional repressor) of toxin-antitoxin stability system
MMSVTTEEATIRLLDLLAQVQEKGETVVICRGSVPVAELRPVAAVKEPFRTNPRLAGVVFLDDPSKPLDPGDWPEAD